MPKEPDFNPYAADDLTTELEPSGSKELAPVRQAIGWIMIAFVLQVFGAFGCVAAMAILDQLAGLTVDGPLIVFLTVASCIAFRSIVLYGYLCCLAAPAEARGRAPLAVALFFGAIAILLIVGAALEAVAPQLWLVALLFEAAATVAFVLFVKRLATFIEQPMLAGDARDTLIYAVIVVVAWFLASLTTLATRNELVMAMSGLVVLVIGLIVVVKYIRLLTNLREALRVAN